MKELLRVLFLIAFITVLIFAIITTAQAIVMIDELGFVWVGVVSVVISGALIKAIPQRKLKMWLAVYNISALIGTIMLLLPTITDGSFWLTTLVALCAWVTFVVLLKVPRRKKA